MSLPTDPVPTFVDSPSTSTPLDSANLNEYSTAIVQLQTYVAGLQVDIPFTSVQTASTVTATANTYVLISTASNSVTVNLPAAPANFTVVGVKMVTLGGSNTVSVVAGGSDHFDTTTGATTATLTLQGQAGVWQYNSSTAVWVRMGNDLPLSQLDARYVSSVTAGDSSVTMGGTTTAPTVKVAQANLTIAESQVTGLVSTLNAGYSSGGQWAPNAYGTQLENMERDDVSTGLLMASGSARTWLILLGWCPASTYASFKLYLSTLASGSGVMTCALYSASTLTNTSWARLGSGNVTMPSLTSATGIISTSLAFTLASPAYVALEMVATTTWSTTYPTFAGGPSLALTSGSAFLNPASGCPAFGTLNASTAPASTLNPTTGFTLGTQKIWCALA